MVLAVELATASLLPWGSRHAPLGEELGKDGPGNRTNDAAVYEVPQVLQARGVEALFLIGQGLEGDIEPVQLPQKARPGIAPEFEPSPQGQDGLGLPEVEIGAHDGQGLLLSPLVHRSRHAIPRDDVPSEGLGKVMDQGHGEEGSGISFEAAANEKGQEGHAVGMFGHGLHPRTT